MKRRSSPSGGQPRRQQRRRGTSSGPSPKAEDTSSPILRDGGGSPTPSQVRALATTVGNAGTRRLMARASGETAAAVRQTGQPTAGLQREDEPDALDRAWAIEARSQLRRVEDEMNAARGRLSTDSRAAIGSLRDAQESYEAFEKRFQDARASVVNGLAESRARAEAVREGATFVAGLALAPIAPKVFILKGAAKTAVTGMSNVATAAAVAHEIAEPSTSIDDIPTSSDRIDWSGLLDVALDAFTVHLDRSDELDALDGRLQASLRFLGDALAGEVEGDPWSDPRAERARQLVDRVGDILASLATIEEGVVSQPASDLSSDVTASLGAKSENDICQELVVRWLARVQRHEMDFFTGAIRDVRSYLEEIGVAGEDDSRLNFDWGMVFSDVDEKNLRMVAMAESQAMDTVGGPVRRVNRGIGDWFLARDTNGITWRAVPEGSATDVDIFEVTAYHVDRSHDYAEEWSYETTPDRMRADITLTVRPVDDAEAARRRFGPQIRAG